MPVRTLVILLLPAAIALAFLFVPGRRHRAAHALKLRGWWLIVVVVLVTAIGDRVAADWDAHEASVNRMQAVLVVLACALFAWLNRKDRPVVRGAVLAVAVGSALNAVATLAYGGMPVLAAAGRSAGYSASDLAGTRPKVGYVLSDDKGWFAKYAGDFIPVPDGKIIFSVGDVLLWGGLAVLLVIAFRSVAPVRGGTSANESD